MDERDIKDQAGKGEALSSILRSPASTIYHLSSIIYHLSFILVFALFARTVAFSFIGLDDAAYTFRNPFVAGGLSASNVVEAFTNLRHGGIWMPVTYISYMLDASLCSLIGIPLIGEMHLVNVLLHVVNFLLLWKLLRLLFPLTTELPNINCQPSTAIAAIAAMVWAVHPLRAEPVAWIAARKELLWTLFTLSGLICWIKSLNAQQLSTANRQLPTTNYQLPTINYQLSTIIFCALACLSKPTAMCFPFLALLVAWWIGSFPQSCRAVENPSARSPSSILHFPPSTIIYHLSTFLIAAATAAIAAYSQTHVAGQDMSTLYAAPLSHRLVNAFSAIGYYIRATFWPFGLHVDCRSVPGIWPLDAGWNFLALGIAVSVAIVCHFTFSSSTRSARPNEIKATATNYQLPTINYQLFFLIAWFLIPLIPTLGILGSFGIEAHADRFAYLPSMAFSFLLVIFARYLTTNHQLPTTNYQLPTTNYQLSTTNYQLPTIIVTILLSLLTFRQLSYWRDDATAHLRALACDPGHPRAMVHVADARCSRQRDFDGGIRLYRQALARADTVPKGGFDAEDVKAKLAYALATRGWNEDFEEVKRLGAAVLDDNRLDRRGMMLDALGTAFMHDGDLSRAAQLFKASLVAPNRFWPKASTQRKLELIGR